MGCLSSKPEDPAPDPEEVCLLVLFVLLEVYVHSNTFGARLG